MKTTHVLRGYVAWIVGSYPDSGRELEVEDWAELVPGMGDQPLVKHFLEFHNPLVYGHLVEPGDRRGAGTAVPWSHLQACCSHAHPGNEPCAECDEDGLRCVRCPECHIRRGTSLHATICMSGKCTDPLAY